METIARKTFEIQRKIRRNQVKTARAKLHCFCRKTEQNWIFFHAFRVCPRLNFNLMEKWIMLPSSCLSRS
jgi:hypothetical protein